MIQISVNIHAVKDKLDNIQYIEGIITDITHKKLIEKYKIAKESAELTGFLPPNFQLF